ncbi:MAG: NAD(P)-dependent oxidoreductase [Syntrophaceae bacterium]|nr:NAD(P)-dependent oxidoreductase [Syntrophaceae bacterium]
MKERTGFIGLGNMGLGMARNILKAGFPLTAYDIREEPLRAIEGMGGERAKSPREISERARITFVVVLNYPQIEQVLLGEQGLQGGVRAGDVIVLMSTISPVQVKELAQKLENRGVQILDAPISGGKEGAEAGTLSIMVGGDKPAVERCLPMLQAMGKNIRHLGGVGSGMSMKLVNNLLVAVNGLAVAEAMTLGKRAGLNPQAILEIIPKSAGDSWMFRNRAPQMVSRDFTCRGELDILVKDLTYILEMGQALKVPLFLGAVAREVFQVASRMGWGKEDDSAVVKAVEMMGGQNQR